MATKYYLKLYYEMLDDWKILSLPESLKWRYVQCLLVAGELNEDGWLPEIRQFASRIRPMDPESLKQDLARLAAVELVELRVDDDDNERWFIPKFETRQQRSANAKRQAAWRERQKELKEKEKNQKKKKEEEENKEEDIYVDIDTRNVTSNVHVTKRNTNTYDQHEENQNHIDTITAICNVVKGENPLMPSEQLDKFAYYLESQNQANEIIGFSEWWEDNQYYTGRPALKSFIQEWDNYLDGITLTHKNGSGPAEPKSKMQKGIDAIDQAFNEMEAQGLI